MTVGNFTPETAAYVAGYVLKKQSTKMKNWYYTQQGKIPEYTGQSRYPAIGANYYEKHKDKIYLTDEIYIPGAMGVMKLRPTSYYDNKYGIENPERMEEIKARREKIAIQNENHKMKNCNYTKDEAREIKTRTNKRKKEMQLAGRTEL